MDRAQKEQLVSTLNGAFSEASVVVVCHYSGLNVADMTSLRTQMREAGASIRVAKNRLVKRALEGVDMADINPLLTGPTVFAYSGDPVAAAKVCVEFAKTNPKLIVLGGAMGQTQLDPSGVKALADLPSLEELRGTIVGMIQTPARRIATLLQAPASQIARVIQANADKDAA